MLRISSWVLLGGALIGLLGWLGWAAYMQTQLTWFFGTTFGYGPFALAVLTLLFAGANAIASQRQARISSEHLKIANDNSLLAQRQVASAIEASSQQIKLGEKSLENAAKVLEQNARAELASRFQRAAELLNSGELATRVGGIMLLQEIGKSHPDRYYNVVLNLLIVFAEQHTKDAWEAVESLKTIRPSDQESSDDWETAFAQTPDDVMTAVRAIGDIRQYENWEGEEAKWLGGQTLRLRRVTLVDQTIVGGNFSRMNIENGFLSNMTFGKCRFERTRIDHATTIGVRFQDCDLRDATIMTDDVIATPSKEPRRDLRFTHETDLRDATIIAKNEDVRAKDYKRYDDGDELIFGQNCSNGRHRLSDAIDMGPPSARPQAGALADEAGG